MSDPSPSRFRELPRRRQKESLRARGMNASKETTYYRHNRLKHMHSEMETAHTGRLNSFNPDKNLSLKKGKLTLSPVT